MEYNLLVSGHSKCYSLIRQRYYVFVYDRMSVSWRLLKNPIKEYRFSTVGRDFNASREIRPNKTWNSFIPNVRRLWLLGEIPTIGGAYIRGINICEHYIYSETAASYTFTITVNFQTFHANHGTKRVWIRGTSVRIQGMTRSWQRQS